MEELQTQSWPDSLYLDIYETYEMCNITSIPAPALEFMVHV